MVLFSIKLVLPKLFNNNIVESLYNVVSLLSFSTLFQKIKVLIHCKFWLIYLDRLSTWPARQLYNKAFHNLVYFNQQTHACACVCMVENNEKCLRIIKKYPCKPMHKHAFAGWNTQHTILLFFSSTLEQDRGMVSAAIVICNTTKLNLKN